MGKIITIVLIGYAAYYLINIAYDLMSAPKGKKAKNSNSYMVSGYTEDEEPVKVEPILPSDEGAAAIEKKN